MPKFSGFSPEKEILKEKLFFLRLPIDEARFGGVGISIDGDKSHFIGAINVDTSGGDLRPFLKHCIRKTGEMPYPLMEHNGDSFFYCQMIIDEESLPYVEESGVAKKRLKPLYEKFKTAHIPPFKFWLRLDATKKIWISKLMVNV